jgi:hypothetical protein
MKITTHITITSFDEDGETLEISADVTHAARFPPRIDPDEPDMYSIKNLELSIEGDPVDFEKLKAHDQDEVNLKLVTLYQEYKQGGEHG